MVSHGPGKIPEHPANQERLLSTMGMRKKKENREAKRIVERKSGFLTSALSMHTVSPRAAWHRRHLQGFAVLGLDSSAYAQKHLGASPILRAPCQAQGFSFAPYS